MTELFSNISDELRQEAQLVWDFVQTQSPEVAINLINTYISFKHTEEEQEFLEFFFSVQLEKLKNE